MSTSRPESRSEAFERLLRDKKGLRKHADETSDIKIENCVGFVKVPVGLAGPLLINGPNIQNERAYAPLATTEAALVASCSRGCKAFNACGGIQFDIIGDSMSRAPGFYFETPREAINFSRRIPELQTQIAETAEATSKHLRFQRMKPHVLGVTVHLQLSYHCGDATGQNMVTFATQMVCQMLASSELASDTKLRYFVVEGQMSSDKKPSWGAVMAPRGVEVMAWGTLTNSACEEILGIPSYNLYLGIKHSMDAGMRNGHFGSHINPSNIIAAMFIATGQDAACVADSSWTQLIADYDNETQNVEISLYIPTLPVGVIGGGTGYETQNECLQILRCAGKGMKGRLAGLIASFALALEISTLGAIMSNTFSQSHHRLARSPPQARKEKQRESKL